MPVPFADPSISVLFAVLIAVNYLAYFKLWPKVTPLMVGRKWESVGDMNRRCWFQNSNSFVHSLFVVSDLLVTVVPNLPGDGENKVLWHSWHVDVASAVSLAYMLFSTPWMFRVYFVEKEKEVTKPTLLIHHVAVVLGQSFYLCTGITGFYGAMCLLLMELTNLFYMPHVFMSILDFTGVLQLINGSCLAVSFIVCRLVLCTWLMLQFAQEVVLVGVPGLSLVELMALWVNLLVFFMLTAISFWWFRDVVREAHRELKGLCKCGKRVMPAYDTAQAKV